MRKDFVTLTNTDIISTSRLFLKIIRFSHLMLQFIILISQVYSLGLFFCVFMTLFIAPPSRRDFNDGVQIGQLYTTIPAQQQTVKIMLAIGLPAKQTAISSSIRCFSFSFCSLPSFMCQQKIKIKNSNDHTFLTQHEVYPTTWQTC